MTQGPAINASGRPRPIGGRWVNRCESVGVGELLGANALSGLGATLAMLVRRGNESGEQRVRLQRFGLKFRMKLAAQKPGMIGNFANFHVDRIRGLASDAQSTGRQNLLILAVE